MTDQQLLRLCLRAFACIPVAANAREMLKDLDCKVSAYAGNGSHSLSRTMADMIREHLSE